MPAGGGTWPQRHVRGVTSPDRGDHLERGREQILVDLEGLPRNADSSPAPMGALEPCGVRPGRAGAVLQNLLLLAPILDLWHCLGDTCDDRNQK